MATEIVVDAPKVLALAAYRSVFGRRFGVFLLIVVPILCMLIWLCSRSVPIAIIIMNLMVLPFAVIFPLLIYFAFRRRIILGFKSIPVGPYIYSVTETGVSWKSPIGRTEVNWCGFSKIYRFKKIWVLIIARNQFVPLPLEKLDDQARMLITANVRTK